MADLLVNGLGMVVTAGIHSKTYGKRPDLLPVHNNLGSAFFLYRGLISTALLKEDPKSAIAAELLLAELHKNMNRYWFESFNPALEMGYRLGSDKLSDEFIQAAAGKQSGAAAVQINRVSDKAFLEGYNAALNKNWERAVAWERVSKAYGLDPAQMRKWVTGYPQDGYHPEEVPAGSKRLLDKYLFSRSERIAGHELWSAFQMSKQYELSLQIENGILPENVQKVWTTAHDELVCPTCGPMDNVSILVDETFQFEDGEFYAPPIHINCRCEIHVYLPNIITKGASPVAKAMGSDKYDRDAKGRFAANEGRSPRSPFIVEEEPDQWPDAHAIAVRPSDQIPEKIDRKKEKKEVKEITRHLLDSELDEHVDPVTRAQAKENEAIAARVREELEAQAAEKARMEADQAAAELAHQQEIQTQIEAQRAQRRKASRARYAARKKAEEEAAKAEAIKQQEEFVAAFTAAEADRKTAAISGMARGEYRPKTIDELLVQHREIQARPKSEIVPVKSYSAILDENPERYAGRGSTESKKPKPLNTKPVEDMTAEERLRYRDALRERERADYEARLHLASEEEKRALEEAQAAQAKRKPIPLMPQERRVGHTNWKKAKPATKSYEDWNEQDVIKRLFSK